MKLIIFKYYKWVCLVVIAIFFSLVIAEIISESCVQPFGVIMALIASSMIFWKKWDKYSEDGRKIVSIILASKSSITDSPNVDSECYPFLIALIDFGGKAKVREIRGWGIKHVDTILAKAINKEYIKFNEIEKDEG